MTSVLIAAGCILVAYLGTSFLKALRDVQQIPGYRPMFSPLTLFGAVMPNSWWNLGLSWTWKFRQTAFFNHSHDVISMVPWLQGQPAYYTCSLEVAQQLLGNEGQRQLIKPRQLTSALLLWGENVFSSNDDMWKRHRRVMAPAFNSKTYAMVLQQAMAIYREMIEKEGWEDKPVVVVNGFRRIPLRAAFLVIARCGFGLPLTWAVDEQESVDEISASHALALVTETVIPRLILPSWIYKFPIKQLQTMDRTWKSLAVFMRKSVGIRAQELADDPDMLTRRGDVFTRLVAASDGVEKYNLNEDEVIGNTFMMMFAGHETTALVLAATFAFLGIHQEEQEKAYCEISSVIQPDREPTLEDLPKLTHTLACFNETLRLYPAGPMLTRTMPEDVVVKVKRPLETTIMFKKDALVIIDMIGVHRNPHTFPEPDKFKPSRWYGVSEHDVSMFGNGPRSCIGRKFSHTEALTFLSLFLRDWHVDVVLEDEETREQYEKRVMMKAGYLGMSFGVAESINLKLSRRK